MKLYIGNQPDPAERTLVEVSDQEFAAVRRLVLSRRAFTVTVFDEITKTAVTLADEDCGLGCHCALKFVKEPA
jgi:hypothetical protein